MQIPRFQFRLRTLLIVVSLSAICCGYIANEAKIARERQSYLRDGNRFIRMFFLTQSFGHHSDIRAFDLDREPSALRRWLGDEQQGYLVFETSASASEIDAAMTLFPEAAIYIVPFLDSLQSQYDRSAGAASETKKDHAETRSRGEERK